MEWSGGRETDCEIAQNRLGQVSGHLAGSGSKIASTKGDARAKLLEKNDDDVCLPFSFPPHTPADVASKPQQKRANSMEMSMPLEDFKLTFPSPDRNNSLPPHALHQKRQRRLQRHARLRPAHRRLPSPHLSLWYRSRARRRYRRWFRAASWWRSDGV